MEHMQNVAPPSYTYVYDVIQALHKEKHFNREKANKPFVFM